MFSHFPLNIIRKLNSVFNIFVSVKLNIIKIDVKKNMSVEWWSARISSWESSLVPLDSYGFHAWNHMEKLEKCGSAKIHNCF